MNTCRDFSAMMLQPCPCTCVGLTGQCFIVSTADVGSRAHQKCTGWLTLYCVLLKGGIKPNQLAGATPSGRQLCMLGPLSTLLHDKAFWEM